MPPKPKFTREEIVAAALELVSEIGMMSMRQNIKESGVEQCQFIWESTSAQRA